MSVAAIVAITWEVELRGIIVTLIGVTVLMGSIYLLLGTNLGARLGFMVALCGLSGWMALMGAIWAVYGIGLQGPRPRGSRWRGRRCSRTPPRLAQAGIVGEPVELPDETSWSDVADSVSTQLVEEEGWEALDPSSPAAGQAGASAGEFLEETGAFEAGEYQVTRRVRHRGRTLPDDRRTSTCWRSATPRTTPSSRSPRSSRRGANRDGRRRRARSTRPSRASTST